MSFDLYRIPPQDYDTPPLREDACPVCDKIDCECPSEEQSEFEIESKALGQVEDSSPYSPYWIPATPTHPDR